MVKCKITKLMVKISKQKAESLGILKNSITKGEGSQAGYIGEEMVKKYLRCKSKNTFDYDLVKKGKTLEVKTKRCNSEPKPHYESSITANNIKQKCSYYIFVRVLSDYSYGWILGFCSKRKYFNNARFCRAGSLDYKSGGKWSFKANCYNLPISKLTPIEKFRL